MIVRAIWTALGLLALAAWTPASADPFVRTAGTKFILRGKPFFVAGANNHYLPWGSEEEVTQVLDDAVALGANTIRTLLGPVIGSPDGSTPTIWNWKSKATSYNLGVNGTYLLYWDARERQMGINDGPNGLQKIDFLIAEAGKRNLKLIIAFLDFWDYTGGAQQMRAWYKSNDKSTFFFSDSRTKRDYKTWVSYVLNRVNSLTGVAYRDDPTIMAWDLMNEGNATPESLRLAWTAEMSAYVKALDPNHLVSSGNANVTSPLVDLPIPTLDFGTWHGYPLYYKQTVQEFDAMITKFCQLAAQHNKPVLLEEFGYSRGNHDAAEAFTRWLNTLTRDPNCAGWLVWELVSKQNDGTVPNDPTFQFEISRDDSPIWKALKAGTIRSIP
ncbi:glycoside hydrolase 5 family protein [Methylobacterium nodulans]|uniref:mannan endo-1,4-beta-mannosidase n=1 Tax=Methylobacterium nodulans (strain LMG 21967 / CNCM I-2342 / ORS 2060) TaxID=460265 RepID=B8IHE0_METNO|nr:cellulase family glycosylhydrolase [Methylobacterium nodulans]ACL61603.1 glycoside hydrolase family 5 [Methylobacterium nodulans ORS 2060]